MQPMTDWQDYQNPKTLKWYRIRQDDWLLWNRLGQDGGRGYQVQLQDWVRDYFQHRPHRRALDVGANMGITAIEYAEYFDTVEAFEPVPDVHLQLERVLRLNGVTNVVAHRVALSDRSGPGEIGYRASNSFASHLRPGGGTMIDLRTVDSYEFDAVDFIKIDVEGLEPEVIAGARETIQRHRPLIQLEYKPKFGRRSGLNIHHTCEWLESQGYGLADKRGTPWRETRLNDLFAQPVVI